MFHIFCWRCFTQKKSQTKSYATSVPQFLIFSRIFAETIFFLLGFVLLFHPVLGLLAFFLNRNMFWSFVRVSWLRVTVCRSSQVRPKGRNGRKSCTSRLTPFLILAGGVSLSRSCVSSLLHSEMKSSSQPFEAASIVYALECIFPPECKRDKCSFLSFRCHCL